MPEQIKRTLQIGIGSSDAYIFHSAKKARTAGIPNWIERTFLLLGMCSLSIRHCTHGWGWVSHEFRESSKGGFIVEVERKKRISYCYRFDTERYALPRVKRSCMGFVISELVWVWSTVIIVSLSDITWWLLCSGEWLRQHVADLHPNML